MNIVNPVTHSLLFCLTWKPWNIIKTAKKNIWVRYWSIVLLGGHQILVYNRKNASNFNLSYLDLCYRFLLSHGCELKAPISCIVVSANWQWTCLKISLPKIKGTETIFQRVFESLININVAALSGKWTNNNSKQVHVWCFDLMTRWWEIQKWRCA